MNNPESVSSNKSTIPKSSPTDKQTPLEPGKSNKFYNKVQELKKNFKRRESSCILIQRVWRGHAVRRRINLIENRNTRISNAIVQEKIPAKEKCTNQTVGYNQKLSISQAMSIINKAIYKYITNKRALQQDFIRKYIRYAAIKIQRCYRGYRVRKACKFAMRRMRNFQAFISSFIKGWKTRRILRHNSIVCIIREIQELGKMIQKEYQNDPNKYWADIPNQINRNKQALITKFDKLYVNGAWASKDTKSSPVKNNFNKHFLIQRTQEIDALEKDKSPDNKKTEITNKDNFYLGQKPKTLEVEEEKEVSFGGAQNQENSNEIKTPTNQTRTNQWEKRENKFIVLNEFSSPTKSDKEDSDRITSAEKRTPEKKDFLRRSIARYDPRRSIERAKESSRLLSQERSNTSVDDKDDRARSTSIEQKKNLNKSPSTLSNRNSSQDRLPKDVETKKEKMKSRNEKDTSLTRFGTARKSSFATLETKTEEKISKLTKTNRNVDAKKPERTTTQRIKTASDVPQDKLKWKGVTSRVSCWKDSNTKTNQNPSQSKIIKEKETSIQRESAPPSIKSPFKPSKPQAENYSMDAKPKPQSKKEVVRTAIVSLLKKVDNNSVKKLLDTVEKQLIENQKMKKGVNRKEQEDSSISSHNTIDSSGTAQLDKRGKRELSSLSEARAQRRKSNSVTASRSQMLQTSFVEKFKELDNSFEKQASSRNNAPPKDLSTVKNTSSLSRSNSEKYDKLFEMLRAKNKA